MPAGPRSLTPAVVLVVDDELPVLRMMARSLLEAGYTVHEASSGQDALALAETLGKPLDLVVTDIRMEPIGGPELAESLFARGLASRFLFVSGYGAAAEYNEQFGPFLPKPFSPQRLVEAVADLLGSP
jgi:two-component system, cell cycle sensor histidine kinase and response regulator CckA